MLESLHGVGCSSIGVAEALGLRASGSQGQL